MLVLLNLVEHNVCIAAKAFVRLCVDAILIIVREGVHQDVRLSAGDMHTTAATFDLAALDLAIVALGNLEARSKDLVDFNSLNQLLGTFALDVDSHYLTVADGRVLDFDCVVWVGKAVNTTGSEILELSV